MKKNNLFEQMNRMRTLMKVKVLTEQTAALEKTAEELWNYAKRLLARGGERTSEESVGNVLKRLESLVDKESKQYLEYLGQRVSRVGAQNAEKKLLNFWPKTQQFRNKYLLNWKLILKTRLSN